MYLSYLLEGCHSFGRIPSQTLCVELRQPGGEVCLPSSWRPAQNQPSVLSQ